MIYGQGASLVVYFMIGAFVENEVHVAYYAKCPLPDTLNGKVGPIFSSPLKDARFHPV